MSKNLKISLALVAAAIVDSASKSTASPSNAILRRRNPGRPQPALD